MNRFIIFHTFFALTAAAVISEVARAKIVEYENSSDGLGSYKFSYKTSNGISRKETGHLVNVGTEDEHIVVSGSYSYTDTNGKLVFILYTADENGYQVKLHEDKLPSVNRVLSSSVVATLLGK